jgi:hypothetical protein
VRPDVHHGVAKRPHLFGNEDTLGLVGLAAAIGPAAAVQQGDVFVLRVVVIDYRCSPSKAAFAPALSPTLFDLAAILAEIQEDELGFRCAALTVQAPDSTHSQNQQQQKQSEALRQDWTPFIANVVD